ncbi:MULTISPECIES: Tn3 family transposase [Bacillaceae]|uniref:Tn3 family transposase n=1 Tax=Bacillaceae TaxID=186817 RepID=UPI000A5519A7|nr:MULTISPECIES: Tn3 family transposase [Bacillaceae]MBF8118806.1 Tn3 family transposase [Bacillus cereus]MCA1203281.1 Tn3 family transposase [Priestia flexa]MED4587663.1 Tn3 family transposase [Priestia flexa]
MRGRELLSVEQRNELLRLVFTTEEELAMYYTLSEYDIEVINRHRRDHNRLGFAIQLCILRQPGCSLVDLPEKVPEELVRFVAKQIGVDPTVFNLYAKRDPTRREHLEEIRKEYGYRSFQLNDYREISYTLLQHALENGNTLYLVQSTINLLRKRKIILPALSTIERLVWETRKRAEKKIFMLLTKSLCDWQKRRLDELIASSKHNKKTLLAWLKEIPGQSSPDAFLKVIKRLEYVRDLNLSINITDIHPNRLLQLARIGSRYDAYSFRSFKDSNKRYAILVAFLLTLSQDLIDQAIEIHDRQMLILQSKGRKQQEEIQKQNGKLINEKVVQFADIGSALIKAKEDGLNPFEIIENVMPWEKIVESVEEAKRLARPMNYDYLDLLSTRFSYLRKYTPILLKVLEFRSSKGSQPLLQALNTINEMNETGKRKVPDGAPLDFVPKRWEKHVYDEDGSINRKYYELAALNELKNHIRSGDVWVVGSRLHKDFEEYLVPKEEWNKARIEGNRLAVSVSATDYISERTSALHKRLHWITNNLDSLEGVNLEKSRIQLERLDKSTPEEARTFSLSLYNLLPRIKLTDLLIEVANWTGFDNQFIHASTNRPPKGEEKAVIMATLMAMGTNIGLTKMAEATPDISYSQMINAMQWRLHEDALTRAQATLVNFQHRLSLASYWGDGTTSSSDGMRVPIGVSSLHADSNPHYGTGKGATIYRFTSDQFSSFYTKVINTNARDAVHVIDGLLHHESDLCIEEHYTDTAGYTDQVFGLSHILGFRFAPRLRDLADSKLYFIGQSNDFPRLEGILRGKINTKIIQENYDDVLRLAHSIREGKVSGSLIMGKLGSYARQNKVATALREMGRIEKTIFILDYISNEALRRRIQRGLNKGESMNSLARALFFGKRGELRERGLRDQLQRASALNILINAISVWNTVYLTEATKILKEKGILQENLLQHISPLGWEHINFLGEYKFDLNRISTIDSLRPLNQ